MSTRDCKVTFERLTDLEASPPTLVEGLPGHGLVAAIAVDQITRQLNLAHHGNIVSDDFPPIASFEDGRLRDVVRVYAGAEPSVMTLQSDLALPPSSFPALAECVLGDLAAEFDRAVFLAGAPARTEAAIGSVSAVATDDRLEADLNGAGIELAEGPGLIGGVTGALINRCYRADLPAAVLIVEANPYLPDPSAAAAVIENALEPLLGFDVDTQELREQADRIKERMNQIAKQYQQMQQEGVPAAQQPPSPTPSMYQ